MHENWSTRDFPSRIGWTRFGWRAKACHDMADVSEASSGLRPTPRLLGIGHNTIGKCREHYYATTSKGRRVCVRDR